MSKVSLRPAEGPPLRPSVRFRSTRSQSFFIAGRAAERLSVYVDTVCRNFDFANATEGE